MGIFSKYARRMINLSLCCILFNGPIGGAFSVAQSGQNPSTEERLYDAGVKAVNLGDWVEATSAFQKVIDLKGRRADGAYYWKAYSLQRYGQIAAAKATCEDLRRLHPESEWLNECSELELNVRPQYKGDSTLGGKPDDDMRMFALNRLMQENETQGLVQITEILRGNYSEDLKRNALLVVSHDSSSTAQKYLDDVAEFHNDPIVQTAAIQIIMATRGHDDAALFQSAYKRSSDAEVKITIIDSYLIRGDLEDLTETATVEKNSSIANKAIEGLVALHAGTQLEQVYRDCKDIERKSILLDALLATGHTGVPPLQNIVSSESDPRLERKAVQYLAISGGADVGLTLVDVYFKAADPVVRKEIAHTLYITKNAHDLISLAKSESIPELKEYIISEISRMHNDEATRFMQTLITR